jgi:hypothetical protein
LGGQLASTVMLSDRVAVAPAESVTCTEKLEVPEPVGVPEMTPLEDRMSPTGSEPEVMDQRSGEVPPLADSVVE